MTTDKNLLRNRFAANLCNYNSLAVVQAEICAQLAEMAQRLCDAPSSAMEIGAGTGFLTARLTEIYPEARWTVNDIVTEAERYIAPLINGRDINCLWGDAESLDLPLGLDMIASASTIQWFDDTKRFLSRAHRALNHGGWLCLSTFGPENFTEIKATTGQGLEYYTAAELKSMLQKTGFETEKISEYVKSLHFDSPIDVLRHIKATGVNSIGTVRWTKKDLRGFETAYRKSFPVGSDKVSLTYHPILIVARKL